MITSYDGEFGYELIGVVPYAYYLHLQHLLVKTESCKDTKALYYFSPQHLETFVERRDVGLAQFPLKHIYFDSLDTSQWVPPPYKQQYANSIFRWDKPVAVISNKYNMEWNLPPINYLTTEMLVDTVGLLRDKYQVIYNRPESKHIVWDQAQKLEYDDKDVLKDKFGNDVILMEEIHEQHPTLSFNTLQMMVYANTDRFVSVSGGNSILCSYFGGKNCIYAKKCEELCVSSYTNWYKYFGNAEITVATTLDELIRSLS